MCIGKKSLSGENTALQQLKYTEKERAGSMKTTFLKKATRFLASALSAVMCLTFTLSGAFAETNDEAADSTTAAFEVIVQETDCACSENEHIHTNVFCLNEDTASVYSTCIHNDRGAKNIGNCPTCNSFLYVYYCKSCGTYTGKWCRCGLVSFI